MTADNVPILIAGPTASGKSALALRLAELVDGCIVNADALQVYDCWSILSARPSAEEKAKIPHHLYGHIGKHISYSVGRWLREFEQILKITDKRPIVVGGTGLYFLALTKGLAQIPEIPSEIRKAGDALRIKSGITGFTLTLSQNDPKTLAKLDQNNPARLQRAWEVWTATGRGLADWQEETSRPLVNPINAVKITLTTEQDWLKERIERRFNEMMEIGVLDEVRTYLKDGWDPKLPSAKAIGARELVAYLNGTMDINSAIRQAKTQTQQYAKRQRTWLRSKMADWHQINPQESLTAAEIQKIVSHFP